MSRGLPTRHPRRKGKRSCAAAPVQADGRLADSGTVTAVGGITNQGEIDMGSGGLNLAGGTLTNTGLVRGGGTIDNPLVNSAGGEVRVAAGQQMHWTDTSAQSNAGGIEVIGTATQPAEIEFDVALTNVMSTGNITARHAILRFNGDLTNQTVGISFGTSDVHGDVDNQAAASITVTGNSNVTFWDDMNNDGTVEVSTGSTAVYFAGVTVPGTGSFPGGGTNIFHADLAPGSSPGKVDFGGDVVFGASARLESELAGTTPGSEHDQLDITGSVSLDGKLDVVPVTPYSDPSTPGTADDFVLITAGTRSGNFTTIQYDGSPLTADFGPDGDGSFRDHVGGGLFRSLTYTATTVELQNLSARPGDTEGDKDVDITDFNILATNFDPGGNNSATNDWTTADFDVDGDIDITDFNSLASNFAPGGYGAANSIPEPSTMVLCVLGGVGAGVFLVRKRR